MPWAYDGSPLDDGQGWEDIGSFSESRKEASVLGSLNEQTVQTSRALQFVKAAADARSSNCLE